MFCLQTNLNLIIHRKGKRPLSFSMSGVQAADVRDHVLIPTTHSKSVPSCIHYWRQNVQGGFGRGHRDWCITFRGLIRIRLRGAHRDWTTEMYLHQHYMWSSIQTIALTEERINMNWNLLFSLALRFHRTSPWILWSQSIPVGFNISHQLRLPHKSPAAAAALHLRTWMYFFRFKCSLFLIMGWKKGWKTTTSASLTRINQTLLTTLSAIGNKAWLCVGVCWGLQSWGGAVADRCDGEDKEREKGLRIGIYNGRMLAQQLTVLLRRSAALTRLH